MISKITRKFIVLIVLVFALALTLNTAWSMRTQYRVIEENLHTKAQLLARELSAAWQFVNVNQELINTTKSGEYEFKGLHCAVVGKSIGAIFSKGNNLVTLHYTNLQTRNPIDAPDEFEKKALRAMQKEDEIWEYYEVVKEEGGQRIFRYLASLTVTESCLECHGEPEGRIDKTGYPMEGWKIGGMGGAISMTISMEEDLAAYRRKVRGDVIFAVCFLLGICVIVSFAVRNWVSKPLGELEAGVKQMKAGNLSIRLEEKELKDEFQILGRDFNSMAGELSALYENLEKQVERRTEELSEANRQLEEQAELLSRANVMLKEDVDLKTHFLNMMSHELRTPLTAILAFTNILMESDTGEEEKSCLKEIRTNGSHLLSMINNTLEMARLEAGKSVLHCELVDIGDVLGSIENVIFPLAEQKGIAFGTEIDGRVPLVWADASKLRHILENLCSNAVKFTSAGGRVSVRAELDEEAGEVRVHVQDNGIGMKPEELTCIFDLFTQSDRSEVRRYNGSGLGLALAKDLAELHGGRITVVSREGEGSCFTLHLPHKEGDEHEDTDC